MNRRFGVKCVQDGVLSAWLSGRMRWTLFSSIMIAGAACASPSDTVGEATGAALQADVKRAMQLIAPLDTARLNEKQRKFVTCMRQRFASATPASLGKPRTFTDRVLATYRSYWHAAITHPETRATQEKRLDTALRKLLKAPGANDFDPLIDKRIAADGNHSLEGRTGFLRELMVWTRQEDKKTTVALPEGQYQVTVHYLDGFKSFGWSHYATCGLAATGGWATDDALFAVMPRYDSPDSEEFKVTFLGHETQHFADKARFKGLKDWELEYRAKLVEIAEANTTRAKVLARFTIDQGDDPGSPHSYANKKVLGELMKRLGLAGATDLMTVDLGRLQGAARDALRDDSAQRAAAGQLKPAP